MTNDTAILDTTNETITVRAARKIDTAIAQVAEDVANPFGQSKVKRGAAVLGVGAAAIALWELAGM